VARAGWICVAILLCPTRLLLASSVGAEAALQFTV
jgi:hypothetical protein